MIRLLATLPWVPLAAILFGLALVSGVLVSATALMIPLVRYLAVIGDGDEPDS